MRPQQWQNFKRTAKGQRLAPPPVSIIVDSPWIPGYLGIPHLDYFLDPDTWLRANLRIAEEFPEIVFLPSWWMEYGMAAEPSALGAKVSFWADRTPDVTRCLERIEDVDSLPAVNPASDAFMALTLHRYRMQKQRIFDAGYTIPLATARGPLCTAAFVRGLSDFMTDLIENPAPVHRLLAKTTDTTIGWLQAQVDAIGPCVEGIFVLDDVVGFLSRRSYLEFAHPYLKRICDAFPKDWVKVYHNDANVKPFLEDLASVGFDVLNCSHELDLAEARRRAGSQLCLMGNVAPLDLGVRGTPGQVRDAATRVLDQLGGEGIILSWGGGTSPGTPKANIEALAAAAREFGASPARS